jgi:hypothetical protein
MQLSELEQRIGVTLPDAYRRFILRFNGGYFNDPNIAPESNGRPPAILAFLSGIGASHPEAELGRRADIALFDGNEPPKVLPIGATPMGDLIILDTAPGDGRGEIYLKQAFGDFCYLADDIESFFGLLREPTPG